MKEFLMRGVNKVIASLPGDFIPGSDAYDAAKLAIDISVDRVQSQRLSSALAIRGDFDGSQRVLTDFITRRSETLKDDQGRSGEFMDALKIVESWLGPGFGESIRSCLLDRRIDEIERNVVDTPKSRSI